VRIGGLALPNRAGNGVVRHAEPHALGAFPNRVRKQARAPSIMAGDFQRGASMRVAGTPRHPHGMARGAAGAVQATPANGAATARVAPGPGVHWRAFVEGAGPDPRNRALATPKRFPGHGDTAPSLAACRAKSPGARQ
jgi:hypothetical protein